MGIEYVVCIFQTTLTEFHSQSECGKMPRGVVKVDRISKISISSAIYVIICQPFCFGAACFIIYITIKFMLP